MASGHSNGIVSTNSDWTAVASFTLKAQTPILFVVLFPGIIIRKDYSALT